jgi:Domain of unknown function (DUF4806)
MLSWFYQLVQVVELAKCGGKDYTEAMTKMGSKLVTDEIGTLYNYTGRNKHKFQDFNKICDCIGGTF